MRYKKSLIDEEKLIKTMLGGVAEAVKDSKTPEGPQKKGLHPALIVLIGLIVVIVAAVIAITVILAEANKGQGPMGEKKKNFYKIVY